MVDIRFDINYPQGTSKGTDKCDSIKKFNIVFMMVVCGETNIFNNGAKIFDL